MCRPTGRHVFCSFPPRFGNNAPTWDNSQHDTLQKFRGICAASGRIVFKIVVTAAFAAMPTACQPADRAPPETAKAAPVSYACGENGFLTTTLHGAIATTLNWQASDLACEGMPRPDGEGARLRFAGSDGSRQIAIIIAMPSLQRGSTGAEIASNVTLIEEGASRFFSTPDLNNCWTDVTHVEAFGESTTRFSIAGTLYCVQPLAEVNGRSSVALTELRFQGLLDWSAS